MSEIDSNVPRETLQSAGDFAVQLLAEGWEESACACGATYRRRKGTAIESCPGCLIHERERRRIGIEAAGIVGRIDQILPRWLERAGLSRRELTASIPGIPAPLRAALWNRPGLRVADLLGGAIDVPGFGISAGAGVGKTFALAAIMREAARSRILARVPTSGKEALGVWLQWASWPETVNRLRVVAASQEDGLAVAGRIVERLSKAPVLVLDDLGAERMRGSYEDDWAASQLDLIVDDRYNDMRPIYFTTNLPLGAFMERYGARLFSRLASESQAIVIPAGPDLRMVKRA